ncbi:MAG TPA: WhiB family transcriptional regulator [Acidimicrobiia bacterium]|nr:WhiB family transcriptional regulator [Acidimicrobiia bacterium]
MIALTLEGEDEQRWRAEARCRDGSGALTSLFFSENLDDIARAKAFCAECPVRVPCLQGALARREPWGVWGGQLVWRGRVMVSKRRRGRPPLPRDPVTGEVVRDPARIAELRAQAEAEERRLQEAAELVAATA